MKVITAIVAALALVGASGAKCHDLCSGGSASCQTSSEAAYCVKGYQLNSNNKCVKCGNTAGLGQGTGTVGQAVGNGNWWEPWNNGVCTTCVANCETCNSKTTCATAGCKPRFFLASSTTCTACPTNCAACSSATTCTSCDTGYKINGANGCQKCTQANCDKCDANVALCDTGKCSAGYQRSQSGTCVACAAGTGVWWSATGNTNAGECANPCTAGCGTCASKSTCTTCANGSAALKTTGYSKVTKSSTCAACTPNCAQCTTADSILCDGTAGTQGGCYTGFLLAGDKTCVACASGVGNHFVSGAKTCKQCSPNCVTCTDATNCNACAEGYTKNGANQCVKCDVGGCKTCDFADKGTQCKSCLSSYYKNANTAKFTKCIQCDPNCTTCSSTFQCTGGACKTGYKDAGNGKCVACNNKGSCAKNNNFFPDLGLGGACNPYPLAAGRDKTKDATGTTIFDANIDTHCISCTAGCKTCNLVGDKGECQDCQASYWPFDAKGVKMNNNNAGIKPTTCKTCTANCAVCTDDTTCTTCKAGSTALKTTGYYRDSKTKTCANACTANCAKCTTADSADCDNGSCFVGFQLSAKKTCVACSSDQQTKEGFHWNAAGNANAGECKLCQANCKVCATATTCQTCKPKFRKTGAGACEACTAGSCDACTNDKAKCTGCSGTLSLSADGSCHSCSGAGQHWNNAGKGTCSTCSANCKVGGCSSATQCQNCNVGYYADSNGKCQACGVANCATCAANSAATLCTSCKGKYAISVDKKSCSNQCDAHATACTDAWTVASCDTAKRYYKSSYNRCVYCDIPPKTDLSGPNHAAKGNKNFFTGKACVECDPNADGCTAWDKTTTCATGYSLVNTICAKDCVSPQKTIGGKGKCFNCGSNVVKGRCGNEWQALECNKGYHVQGAASGPCCGDDSSASSTGLSIVAAAVTAAFAMLH